MERQEVVCVWPSALGLGNLPCLVILCIFSQQRFFQEMIVNGTECSVLSDARGTCLWTKSHTMFLAIKWEQWIRVKVALYFGFQYTECKEQVTDSAVQVELDNLVTVSIWKCLPSPWLQPSISLIFLELCGLNTINCSTLRDNNAHIQTVAPQRPP